jgi:hypothetical protein
LADSPWDIPEPELTPLKPARVRVEGAAAVPPDLMASITATRRCNGDHDFCRLLLAGPDEAVLLSAVCPTCTPFPSVLKRRPDGRWSQQGTDGDQIVAHAFDQRTMEDGRLEVRQVAKRQVFLDGKPVGEIFD